MPNVLFVSIQIFQISCVVTLILVSEPPIGLALVANESCGFVNTSLGQVVQLFKNGILTREQYESVWRGKMKNAKVHVANSPSNICTVEICGFNHELVENDHHAFGDCFRYFDTNMTNTPEIYDENYEVSSIGCACSTEKYNSNCSSRTCDDMQTGYEWKGLQCAVMYQENNCNTCYFDFVVLEHGSEFLSLNSFTIKSMLIRPNCRVEKKANGLLYLNDMPDTYSYNKTLTDILSVFHKDSENYTCHCNESEFEIETAYTEKDEIAIDKHKDKKSIWMVYVLPISGACLILLMIVGVFFKRRTILTYASNYFPNVFVWFDDNHKDNYEMDKYTETGQPNSVVDIAEQKNEINATNEMIMDRLQIFLDEMKELSSRSGGNGTHSLLSPHSCILDAAFEDKCGPDAGMLNRFKTICRPKFELRKNSFMIGEKLGSGHFGIVYKGVMRQDSDRLLESVAIKTLKPEAKEKTIESFFREIKMFQCIGSHENVVGFVGACCHSENLFIVTKFCEVGSMLVYLEDVIKPKICSKFDSPVLEVDDEGYSVSNQNVVNLQSKEMGISLEVEQLRQFLHWSEQIANGMDFLHVKKQLLHVDLACRNILLDSDLTVKICDFGLSKLCIDETDYAQSLLTGDFPINSLAPECALRKYPESHPKGKKISTFIDIWAYGCTIWEIFSLGERPYANMNIFDIVHMFERGERLPQPILAPNVIFSELLKCWEEIPGNRPSFAELRTFFAKELNETYYYQV